MATPLKPRRKGFTLIELLIVILVLAILMAVALPLYLGAVADSQKKTCRANMQTIANAEQAYRLKSPGHVYTLTIGDLTNTVNGVAPDLQSLPACPIQGASAYSVTGVTDGQITVQCSLSDHGTFVPGVDNS